MYFSYVIRRKKRCSSIRGTAAKTSAHFTVNINCITNAEWLQNVKDVVHGFLSSFVLFLSMAEKKQTNLSTGIEASTKLNILLNTSA